MQHNNEPSIEQKELHNIAEKMRQPAPADKWRSTYALVMAELALKNIEKIAKTGKISEEETRLVKLESDAAKLNQDAQNYHLASRLNESLAILEVGMTQLKNSNKSAATNMHNTYLGRFEEYQAMGLSILNGRDALRKQIENYIIEKKKSIAEINNAINNGQPIPVIQDMLHQIEKKQIEFRQKLKDFDKQEDKLQPQLDTLKREVESTLLTTIGVPLMRPEKPTPSLGGSSSSGT